MTLSTFAQLLFFVRMFWCLTRSQQLSNPFRQKLHNNIVYRVMHSSHGVSLCFLPLSLSALVAIPLDTICACFRAEAFNSFIILIVIRELIVDKLHIPVNKLRNFMVYFLHSINWYSMSSSLSTSLVLSWWGARAIVWRLIESHLICHRQSDYTIYKCLKYIVWMQLQ